MGVSNPTNFTHKVHVGYDPLSGGFTGLPDEWAKLLNASAITKEDYARNPQAVIEVLEFYSKETARAGEMDNYPVRLFSPKGNHTDILDSKRCRPKGVSNISCGQWSCSAKDNGIRNGRNGNFIKSIQRHSLTTRPTSTCNSNYLCPPRQRSSHPRNTGLHALYIL